VEVRICTAFKAVINRKASMGHHGRLGWRDIPFSIFLTRAFNASVVSLREGSGAGVEVTCDGASWCRGLSFAPLNPPLAVSSSTGGESEFVQASAVCAAYAEVVNVTAHHDLFSVCIVAAPHRVFEADCLEALLLRKS